MPRKRLASRDSQPSARMKEVAARASVSTMTVSRALRSPDKVAPETLRRIKSAILEVGYVHNQLAGSLKAATPTKLVAMIVPSISEPVFADTIQGLTDHLRSRGINLMLGDSHYSQREEEELIAAFLGQRPSGMVLHNSTHTPNARRFLKNAGIPIVEVGDLVQQRVDLVVSFSNFEAAKAMTTHLVERGYRRIAMVSVPFAGNERAQARREGFRSALKEAGIADDLIEEAAGDFDSGAKAVADLLTRRPEVDAVFLPGAMLAVGAALECRRRGWAVPDRVAIAGFDNWEIMRHLDIPITTLQIPRYEIGKVAADLILKRLDGELKGTVKPIDLGFELLARAST